MVAPSTEHPFNFQNLLPFTLNGQSFIYKLIFSVFLNCFQSYTRFKDCVNLGG